MNFGSCKIQVNVLLISSFLVYSCHGNIDFLKKFTIPKFGSKSNNWCTSFIIFYEGKTAERMIEFVWYCPEKTVSTHLNFKG